MMLRRRTTACLKTLACLFGLTFLWLQLYVTDLGNGSSGRHHERSLLGGGENAANASGLLLNVPPELQRFLVAKPKNSTKGVVKVPGSTGVPATTSSAVAMSDIRRFVEASNEQQAIMNEDLFGPVQSDTVVVVVQVHTRITYLRHLIVSLAQAKDIEGVLLVFSHDFYDEDMNDLIRSVDFCKVMQIFYPYSIQTHPHEFPGESADDCPRNINKEQAMKQKCVNAAYPDLYGHYREAKFTQTKHHWWWKANRVFDQLEVTKNHSGLVLFLEEDHYVSEDFLSVLRLMDKTRQINCDKCNILSLGTYLKSHNYYSDSKRSNKAGHPLRGVLTRSPPPPGSSIISASSWAHSSPSYSLLHRHFDKAEVTPWISSKHNMGMAFNRATWVEIKACAEFFCTYDDYNWDWSLQHISQVCLKHKFHAMVMRGPRVFHIGECGVHHKKKDCESTAVIVKVQGILRNAARYLYPSHLILVQVSANKKLKLRKGNGGWGDKRDHILCLNMTLTPRR